MFSKNYGGPLKWEFSLDEYAIHIKKSFRVHTIQEAVNLHLIRASFCMELYFAEIQNN